MNVDLYEDAEGRYHYQGYEPGAKNARRAPSLCGLTIDGMRKAAWFAVGDPRGQVHYARGCPDCRQLLAV